MTFTSVARAAALVGVFLCTTPALASSAHLLDANAPTPAATLAPTSRAPSLMFQLAAGVAGTLISAPASLAIGTFLGSVSNNLYLSLVPALLFTAFIPALVVSAAVWLEGDQEAPGRYRWWTSFVASSLVNIALLVVAGFLGMSVTVFGGAAALCLAQTVILPLVSVGTMRLFEKDTAVLPISPTTPGGAPTYVPAAFSLAL